MRRRLHRMEWISVYRHRTRKNLVSPSTFNYPNSKFGIEMFIILPQKFQTRMVGHVFCFIYFLRSCGIELGIMFLQSFFVIANLEVKLISQPNEINENIAMILIYFSLFNKKIKKMNKWWFCLQIICVQHKT